MAARQRVASWYQQIEPGIRRQVRLLRDNGFNTYSSCQERMEVAIGMLSQEEDLARLDRTLAESEFEDGTILATTKTSLQEEVRIMLASIPHPKQAESPVGLQMTSTRRHRWLTRRARNKIRQATLARHRAEGRRGTEDSAGSAEMTADRSWDLIEVHAAAGAGGGTPLAVVATAAGGSLVALSLFASPAAARNAAPADADYRPDQAPLPELRRQLAEYFAGKRRDFALPLAPQGTAFERGVWRTLVAIPYGETRSYAEVAMAIGRPTACRAVGRANGSNPIAVVIPCHRVIGSDGSLTGYGGGLELKRLLLDLEGAGRGAEAPAPQPALPF